MKYIIKNCPARIFEHIGSKQSCFDTQDEDERYIHCEDVSGCLLKQIAEKCKEKIIFCKNCSKNANINIDCIECDERGEAHFAQCILNNFLEIEEENE